MEPWQPVGTGGRLTRAALILSVSLLVALLVTDVLTESEAFTATFVVPVFLVALAGSTKAVMALGAAAVLAAVLSPVWTMGGDAGTYAIRVGAVLVGTVFALFAARERQTSILAREEISAALGNLADAVTVQDSSGKLVYANRAAADLLGSASPEELIATPPVELMERFESYTEDGAPLDPEKLPGRRALRGEPSEPLLVRAVNKTTGEERWRTIKSTAVAGPPGTGYRAINVIEDITETKRAEIAQRLLAEAGEELASSLDFKTTLRQVARMAVPGFADWCAVSIPREDGSLDQVAIAHADPDRIRFAEEIRERYPTRMEDAGPQMVLQARRAILLELTDELIRESAKDEEHYRLIQEVGMRSAIAAPMFSGGELLGIIYFITSETGRRLTEDDLEVAEELARRAKIAVLNARLFEERSSAARTLEQALRPPPLPEIPGWRLATMYEPASAGGLVGGDFYDAFPVGDEWMVVIGDVVGRGVQAAGLTAMARYTLRTAGAMTGDPLEALDHLNRWLLEREDMCTAAVAVLGEGGSVRLCSGGHPPPFVVSDGAVTPWVARGTMLGAFEKTVWELEEREVGPGQHLVLYTDGLFELPGRDGRLGEERLRRTFASVPDPDQAVRRARAVLHEFAGGSFNDDMALVVLQREPNPIGHRHATLDPRSR